jgi:hypothetical protein
MPGQPIQQYGNSRAYILERLRREGLLHFVTAIEAGRIPAHTIAVHLGWQRPRPTRGTGSMNQARRRQHQLNLLLREARHGR